MRRTAHLGGSPAARADRDPASGDGVMGTGIGGIGPGGKGTGPSGGTGTGIGGIGPGGTGSEAERRTRDARPSAHGCIGILPLEAFAASIREPPAEGKRTGTRHGQTVTLRKRILSSRRRIRRTSMHKAIAVVLALCGLAGTAAADPAYDAREVADFFAREMLGASRAICIGTVEECEARKAKAAAPFDLLVTFELGSDRLTGDAGANLDAFAAALADPRLAAARFTVEGHTDARGSDAFNLALSQRRASAVRDYLVARGVAAERLDPVGYGESRPRVPDPLDPGNRRVETRIAAVP